MRVQVPPMPPLSRDGRSAMQQIATLFSPVRLRIACPLWAESINGNAPALHAENLAGSIPPRSTNFARGM